MRVPRQETDKARIEIIPMIDVIFFLLVFFMLSTLSMTINRGVPVNLPKAASAQKDLRESFTITVTREGDLFLNKEPMTLHEIGQRVQVGVSPRAGSAMVSHSLETPHRAEFPGL